MSFSWKNVFILLPYAIGLFLSSYLFLYCFSTVYRYIKIENHLDNIESGIQNIKINYVNLENIRGEPERYLPLISDILNGDYVGELNFIYYYDLYLQDNNNESSFIGEFFVSKCLNIHDSVHLTNNQYNYNLYTSERNLINSFSINDCVSIVSQYLDFYKRSLEADQLFLDENQGLRAVYNLGMDSRVEDFYDNYYLPNIQEIIKTNEFVRNEVLAESCKWPWSFDYGVLYVSNSFDIISDIPINDSQCENPILKYRKNNLYTSREISAMGLTIPDWYIEELSKNPTQNFWQKYLDTILK